MTEFLFCAACGQSGPEPGVPPHREIVNGVAVMKACPLLVAEHEARLRVLLAEALAYDRANLTAVLRP